ncbi:uncharacterized protein A4U43_UnF6330 [Asparagus officinalis]|uniref:Uncharacterized protein n=1 Tax=Asparagus officinalis TaxID=4686 RepID=A0A1R3L6H8_ASPOF|nr:uncharacterized protein A4U43_UnF6330 [Asparagus officinalis]
MAPSSTNLVLGGCFQWEIIERARKASEGGGRIRLRPWQRRRSRRRRSKRVATEEQRASERSTKIVGRTEVEETVWTIEEDEGEGEAGVGHGDVKGELGVGV